MLPHSELEVFHFLLHLLVVNALVSTCLNDLTGFELRCLYCNP